MVLLSAVHNGKEKGINWKVMVSNWKHIQPFMCNCTSMQTNTF